VYLTHTFHVITFVGLNPLMLISFILWRQ